MSATFDMSVATELSLQALGRRDARFDFRIGDDDLSALFLEALGDPGANAARAQ